MRCNNEYPLTDGRVNVRLTTNASQQTTSTSQPDSFGVGSVTAGTASAYAYGGAAGYREEGIAPAGLSTAYALEKVGARYYDQAFGAFLTRDTDLSQKPYAYCNGDPVNNCDPTGHWILNIGSPGGGSANTEDIGGAADGYGQGEQDAASSSSSSSSSTSSGSSSSGTGGVTAGVTTSGLSSTFSLTQGLTTGTVQESNGLLTSVGTSGSSPVGGINGLNITYSTTLNLGLGTAQETAGFSYGVGIFKVGISRSSTGVLSETAGITLNF